MFFAMRKHSILGLAPSVCRRLDLGLKGELVVTVDDGVHLGCLQALLVGDAPCKFQHQAFFRDAGSEGSW
jgi:hypothetical protein